MIKKISLTQFTQFQIEYFREEQQQRFGQLFLNTFYTNEVDLNLFYEENTSVAISTILQKYVEV